ncbi:MAG TPA: hypothetical protein VE074_01890, partial [Jatrophihabitantaceae bacterium]|nr:hypothetical protein [Jatrophihabitantaceae bacterium]
MTASSSNRDARRRPVGLVVVAAVAGFVVSQLAPGSAGASPGGPGAAPPQPTIGQYSSASSRPLTGAELQRDAAKQQQASSYYRGLMARADGRPPPAAATSANLAEPYYQQVNEIFCGPATTTMVADFLGVGWTGSASSQQSAAAQLLGTTDDGT